MTHEGRGDYTSGRLDAAIDTIRHTPDNSHVAAIAPSPVESASTCRVREIGLRTDTQGLAGCQLQTGKSLRGPGLQLVAYCWVFFVINAKTRARLPNTRQRLRVGCRNAVPALLSVQGARAKVR
jgi:hypothetical protein